MKQEWRDLRKHIDKLESTDQLDWTELSNKQLNIILRNLHRQERKHWFLPASQELAKRKHLRLTIISGLKLFFAIIAVVIGVFQYFK